MDETTLDRLIEEHLPQALRFAIRLTGDPHRGEEIVQEALVRVARSWKTFRGEARFRTWLFRIVINVFRDRSADQRPTRELPADVADCTTPAPASTALFHELKDIVAEKVSSLPPRQREVLLLIGFEGMRPCEAARMLGISEANVYSTLHVARETLRKELAPYLAEESDEPG